MTDQTQRAVGMFPSYPVAESALHTLKETGFPMEQVSVIAKDLDAAESLEGAKQSTKVGNQSVGTAIDVVQDAASSATWGSVLVGLTSLAIPGVGAVVAAGSVGVGLLGTLVGLGAGAANAASLVKALENLGIPPAPAESYSDRLQQGQYLAIVDGTSDQLHQASQLLRDRGVEDLQIYPVAA